MGQKPSAKSDKNLILQQGIYYFRKTIPGSYREILGRKYWSKLLGTADLRVARGRAKAVRNEYEAAISLCFFGGIRTALLALAIFIGVIFSLLPSMPRAQQANINVHYFDTSEVLERWRNVAEGDAGSLVGGFKLGNSPFDDVDLLAKLVDASSRAVRTDREFLSRTSEVLLSSQYSFEFSFLSEPDYRARLVLTYCGLKNGEQDVLRLVGINGSADLDEEVSNKVNRMLKILETEISIPEYVSVLSRYSGTQVWLDYDLSKQDSSILANRWSPTVAILLSHRGTLGSQYYISPYKGCERLFGDFDDADGSPNQMLLK